MPPRFVVQDPDIDQLPSLPAPQPVTPAVASTITAQDPDEVLPTTPAPTRKSF